MVASDVGGDVIYNVVYIGPWRLPGRPYCFIRRCISLRAQLITLENNFCGGSVK